LACKNKLENVANKLLLSSEICNVGHTNKLNKTDLYYAQINNMKNIIPKLLEHFEKFNIISKKYKNIKDIYIKNIKKRAIDEISNSNEIKNNLKQIKLIENKIKKMSKKTKCFICIDNNNDNNEQYMKYDCNHILPICKICVDKLQKPYICLICCKVSQNLEKCFVIG
jgi:hypothetical protein